MLLAGRIVYYMYSVHMYNYYQRKKYLNAAEYIDL
jgi:hypothetical protein